MELLLNLAWLLVVLALGALLTAMRSKGGAACIHSRAAAWVAYAVLAALLLPVISMTDDRMAIAAPGDSEQIVRRNEASPRAPQIAHYQAVLLHSGSILAWIPPAGTGQLKMRPVFRNIATQAATRRQGRAPPLLA